MNNRLPRRLPCRELRLDKDVSITLGDRDTCLCGDYRSSHESGQRCLIYHYSSDGDATPCNCRQFTLALLQTQRMFGNRGEVLWLEHDDEEADEDGCMCVRCYDEREAESLVEAREG